MYALSFVDPHFAFGVRDVAGPAPRAQLLGRFPGA